ncbi:hypothetical protein D9757_007949 [Collybiopsis confluens]|uniref:L-tyrosine decarboxylase C-terminal domain-containing protein n=1 Tax=Collybiopsis confluens TaxID=2823264 RepID=A0A8H5M4F0_9AGAR|nr:hypothetical protein D9757_007949 [Collybiopsis confluens]
MIVTSNRKPVYAVVAIVGSTEHGACDPVKDLVELRQEIPLTGPCLVLVSTERPVLHVDAAWKAYFATIRGRIRPGKVSGELGTIFVPIVPLKPETKESINHLQYCDSITIDPHKSGYIQYPAGGLLYRDDRMRYLVTWTSPIVYRDDELESIGVYGVEGSKPGAAAVATFFSHDVIGLWSDGVHIIPGSQMYAHLATMSTEDSSFIVRFLNLLPVEVGGDVSVKDQKEFIRTRILPIENDKIHKDEKAWKLVEAMGSDLSINAVNFKIGNNPNQDIVEANYLNKRIFEALSITKLNQVKPKLIITSTVLSQENYGECLDTFKRRLGLEGTQDLYTLVNVVMSPWPTAVAMTDEVLGILKEVIEQECRLSVYRNVLAEDYHVFVMQGTEQLFLVHLAMFNMENHRAHHYRYYPRGDDSPTTLETILQDKEFDARIEPAGHGQQPAIAKGRITGIKCIVQHKLNSKYLTPYPTRKMPFYLYGSGSEFHVDHVYTASPNIQLSAEQVTITEDVRNAKSLVYAQLPRAEISMHPFPKNKLRNPPAPFFFRSNTQFDNVEFTTDVDGRAVLATGTLILGKNIFVDIDYLNEDPRIPDEEF